MNDYFNDLRSRYDRYEPPREWDYPPLWVMCVSILLLAGSIWLGIAIMNDMDTLAETHKFDRTEMPLVKMFVGYMTLPFAVVCAVVNCGYFYYNVKGTIVGFLNSLSKKTYKFGK